MPRGFTGHNASVPVCVVGSLFHKVLQAAGSNRLLELSQLSVEGVHLLGTSGPEPGSNCSSSCRDFMPPERTIDYSHFCQEAFINGPCPALL